MDKSKLKMSVALSCTILIFFTLRLAYTDIKPLHPYMAPLYKVAKKTESSQLITPIEDSEHFMVSAFIDHRLVRAIRVITIMKRNSLQPLYCVYCSTEHDCKTVETEVQVHTDHFGFPFHVADVICKGSNMQYARRVAITTQKNTSNLKMKYLLINNKEVKKTFKFEFTVCFSSLFGNYNNVLQFAQTMEMYKLLGVQHVVIYKTSCGKDLEKLLKYYESEGILEIISWPINKFLNPSTGWNFWEHKGDLHYNGQLVTLNECIYRHMYQSKYVLLNDIDEIIMPYKHANLQSLMGDLEYAHPGASVFIFKSHLFPTTQFEESGKFKRKEWNNIPGVNIMEHIYRAPDPSNVFNPSKMIVNPRKVEQTSVHSSLKYSGYFYIVDFDVSRMIHVREPLLYCVNITKEQLFVDKRVWDFKQELIPNVDQTLKRSGLST